MFLWKVLLGIKKVLLGMLLGIKTYLQHAFANSQYANCSTSQALIKNFKNKFWYHELNITNCYVSVICYCYMSHSLIRNHWEQILDPAGHYAQYIRNFYLDSTLIDIEALIEVTLVCKCTEQSDFELVSAKISLQKLC